MSAYMLPTNVEPCTMALRGSSVWLHWNYTYVGDGPQGLAVLTYKEQVIRFNSRFQNTSQSLAKKIGQNGALTLESPVPVQFNGRVEVISSNSTLVIQQLQYNDSTYQFSSIVYVDSNLGGSIGTNTYNLRPVVSITVNGMSTFFIHLQFSIFIHSGLMLNKAEDFL